MMLDGKRNRIEKEVHPLPKAAQRPLAADRWNSAEPCRGRQNHTERSRPAPARSSIHPLMDWQTTIEAAGMPTRLRLDRRKLRLTKIGPQAKPGPSPAR